VIRLDVNLDRRRKKKSGPNHARPGKRLFKSITKFAYIRQNDAECALGKNSTRRRPVCSELELRSTLSKLVRKNPNNFGIPQGSPLSGLLSNIFMLDFDAKLSTEVSRLSGNYWRYSDDILILVPEGANVEELLNFVTNLLSSNGLAENVNKRLVVDFKSNAGVLKSSPQMLQYLGFLFDGERTLIRPSSLSRYWRKLKSAVKRQKYLVESGESERLRSNHIYQGYSHLGYRRRRVGGSREKHSGCGNFITYALNASLVLDSNEIRGQISGHMNVIDDLLKN